MNRNITLLFCFSIPLFFSCNSDEVELSDEIYGAWSIVSWYKKDLNTGIEWDTTFEEGYKYLIMDINMDSNWVKEYYINPMITVIQLYSAHLYDDTLVFSYQYVNRYLVDIKDEVLTLDEIDIGDSLRILKYERYTGKLPDSYDNNRLSHLETHKTNHLTLKPQ